MRMDVNGDGTLTKREMLAAEEFTVKPYGASGDGFAFGVTDRRHEAALGEEV